MKIKSSLRAFILTGLGLVAMPPAVFATPLTVNVASGTTVVSEYLPSDHGDPPGLIQNIDFVAPATISLNGVNNLISFTLSAPVGHAIQIDPLAEGMNLFIQVNYVDGDATSLGNITATGISFGGLVGSAPTLNRQLGIYPYGLLFQFHFYGITDAFSFTSMTVNSTIDGTGSNVTLNLQDGGAFMQAQDNDYSGPGTEPYASLISVPTAVPEPSTYAMALAGLAYGGYTMWSRRKRA
ncbi:MAG: PEP-CTERM sorting domain-containing protein [Planctomycetota bacterium]